MTRINTGQPDRRFVAETAARVYGQMPVVHEDFALHFVPDTEVTKVLTFPILIAALEAAHRRPKMEVLDAFLGDEKGQYVIRSAVDPGRYMASKMFTSFPSNLAEGKMPAVQAVCVLLSRLRRSRQLLVLAWLMMISDSGCCIVR